MCRWPGAHTPRFDPRAISSGGSGTTALGALLTWSLLTPRFDTLLCCHRVNGLGGRNWELEPEEPRRRHVQHFLAPELGELGTRWGGYPHHHSTLLCFAPPRKAARPTSARRPDDASCHLAGRSSRRAPPAPHHRHPVTATATAPRRTAPSCFPQQVSEEKESLTHNLADAKGEDESDADGVASPKPRLSRGVSESVGVRRRRSVSGRICGRAVCIPEVPCGEDLR